MRAPCFRFDAFTALAVRAGQEARRLRVAPRDALHPAQRAVLMDDLSSSFVCRPDPLVIPTRLSSRATRGISRLPPDEIPRSARKDKGWHENGLRRPHTARRPGRDAGCLVERGLSRRATDEAGTAGSERREPEGITSPCFEAHTPKAKARSERSDSVACSTPRPRGARYPASRHGRREAPQRAASRPGRSEAPQSLLVTTPPPARSHTTHTANGSSP